ncbi:hypothetical protein ACFVAJ_17220 [Agromyces sp. NPDC057679]|uniref:hypothetical protein n=1 Tax=Agromyces sp. NPDC057679 TaxID=3346207 RepID=UPI00366E5523
MKVKTINLDPDELPETITVKLTRAEAITIAGMCGKLSPATAEASGLDYSAASEVYNGLVGTVFNRFWEDGLNEARTTIGPEGSEAGRG